MKKQSKKDMTVKRQKKITRHTSNREKTNKHLTELSNVAGGLQIGLDSLLRLLINKGLITIEEFHQAVNDFGRPPAPEVAPETADPG
ncbi:MAG: hypothetical protein KKC20_19690 [Proteobacteria bacterium]|nr:hypothetical protein [Pseudomonadota bacterium]